MKKSLFVVTFLMFSSLILAAKSYTLTIVTPTKVGSVQLAKGSYSLHVEGDKAVFTDAHSKAVSIPAKLDTGAAKKFEFTSVEATQKDGQDVIKAIHLGGSTTTVEFGD